MKGSCSVEHFFYFGMHSWWGDGNRVVLSTTATSAVMLCWCTAVSGPRKGVHFEGPLCFLVLLCTYTVVSSHPVGGSAFHRSVRRVASFGHAVRNQRVYFPNVHWDGLARHLRCT
jgi:hypothetical protein